MKLFKTSDPCVSRLYFIYLSICFKHLQSQRTLCFHSNEELWWDLEMFKIMSVSFLCVPKYMTTAVVVTVMITMCLWQRQRTQKSGLLVPKCTLVRWLYGLASPQDCIQQGWTGKATCWGLFLQCISREISLAVYITTFFVVVTVPYAAIFINWRI